MIDEKKRKPNEVLTLQEYIEKRKGKRKKEEGSCKVLTKIGWNVIIQK